MAIWCDHKQPIIVNEHCAVEVPELHRGVALAVALAAEVLLMCGLGPERDCNLSEAREEPWAFGLTIE